MAIVAVVVHQIGMEGAYFVWGYDTFAHFCSGVALSLLFWDAMPSGTDPQVSLPLLLVGCFVAGVGWELYELVDPVLTMYGWEDTFTDVVAGVVVWSVYTVSLDALARHRPSFRLGVTESGSANGQQR